MGAFKDMAIEREERAMRGNHTWVELFEEVQVGEDRYIEVTVEVLVTMHRADRRTGDDGYGEVEDMRFSWTKDCSQEDAAKVVERMNDDGVVECLSDRAITAAFEEVA